MSSADAKGYATEIGVCESLFCQSVLQELADPASGLIRTGSSANLSACKRLGLGRSQHVCMKHMFVKGLVRDGRIEVENVSTNDNRSDTGTKAIDCATMRRHC